MESPTLRYILGFLGFLALIVILIVFIFRMAGRNSQPVNVTPSPQLVEMADKGAVLTFTEDGPIVAEEDHFQIRITVSSTNRRVEAIRGYQNTVVAQANFDNNDQAFRSFLSALDRAGYTQERETSLNGPEGLCPRGKRYTFMMNSNGEQTTRWATSCRELGNLGAQASILIDLYQKQVPNYYQFIAEARKTSGLLLN